MAAKTVWSLARHLAKNTSRRLFSTAQPAAEQPAVFDKIRPVEKIRNIGISAHIDS
uniref:Uncharacterized protein n=1 Tax=Panagrolaimus sp. JU765 TaxID=591449 RepID=A0AC34Q6W8_9BILA